MLPDLCCASAIVHAPEYRRNRWLPHRAETVMLIPRASDLYNVKIDAHLPGRIRQLSTRPRVFPTTRNKQTEGYAARRGPGSEKETISTSGSYAPPCGVRLFAISKAWAEPVSFRKITSGISFWSIAGCPLPLPVLQPALTAESDHAFYGKLRKVRTREKDAFAVSLRCAAAGQLQHTAVLCKHLFSLVSLRRIATIPARAAL